MALITEGEIMSEWDSITAEELRIAAKVARASGGHVMDGAADAWELRARHAEGKLALGIFD
jgi:hypothetical protein